MRSIFWLALLMASLRPVYPWAGAIHRCTWQETIFTLTRTPQDVPRVGDPEVRACAISPPTGVQIPLIFTERRISGAPVGSPFRRTGRSPPGQDRSGACRSRCIQPLRTGVSTPGRARDPDPWEVYPPPFPR